MEKLNLNQYFSNHHLQFELFSYQKGEFICRPDKPFHHILILTQGKVNIYGVFKDGSMYKAGTQTRGAVLGDSEYVRNVAIPFYCEAMEDVLCIALDFHRYKKQLDQDNAFLHFILSSLAKKLSDAAEFDLAIQSLEEKVIFYLKNKDDHTLTGIESSAMALQCSRRQLQRVVGKLCKDDILVKKGRGIYQLKYIA